jgi:GcrA cell cycle regulator
MTIDWTAERTEKLEALWNEGIPASQIGRELGVSKNAVVGKAHRLKLPKRQSPIPSKSREAEIIKLDGLGAGMCCWPEGEPGKPEFHFCGKPAVASKPYCAEHCARAYVKSSKERPKENKTTEAA